jgi:hypothetical protein
MDIMMLRQASRTSQTCRCRTGSGHLHHRVREAVVGHAGVEALEVGLDGGKIVARELDEKQAVRLAPGDVGERAPEQRDVGAEHQDVVVHELDRDRPEGDDRLRRLHRGPEGREVAHAHDAMRREPGQLQRHLRRDGKRALRPDEEMGEVRARLQEGVEVVAADPPLHLREHAADLLALALGQRHHAVGEVFARPEPAIPGSLPPRGPRRIASPSGRRARRPSTLSTILP